jgi:soluble epoxide hydrolase/lipid-phosphate phosphatase
VIPKPVLFVVGELDAVGRPELAFQSAEQGREAGLLPDVEVKVVPGSAHWIGLEKPKETFDILDQFAKKVCK